MSFPHNCNKACCDHQSTNDQSEEWNLNSKIDLNNVQCLNEQVDGSCKKIFRHWDDRLNREYVTYLFNFEKKLFYILKFF